jgi:predicted  nucleic acid-binding Zn-ribbon protein
LDAENPNWRTDNMVGKIRTFDQDALSFRQRIKTLKEQIQEEVERAPEYTRVQNIINELKDARADLKRRLERNSTYMGLLQELADERLALTDAERNMSDFLKGYYADTREEQIELTPEDTRMVVIRAKLGKPQDFQTNLFSRVADTEE